MRAAILAAGVGERLVGAGGTLPKPLVPVAGRPLIDHVLSGVVAAGIREVACIINDRSRDVEAHCREAWTDLRFDFVQRTTANSLESLFALAPRLGADRFVLLTTDTIAPPASFAAFVAAAHARPWADAVLGVTGFVDDEKPLWVRFDAAGRVTTLGDTVEPKGWITAGLYVLEPRVFAEVDHAHRHGFAALRQFLGHIVARGYRIEAEPVGKVVDVDRPEDILTAEAYISGHYAT